MTEPSQEPGCRPHLSILIDLIWPSYGCIFAEYPPPTIPEATSANEDGAHRTNTRLSWFPSLVTSLNQLSQVSAPSLPNLALMLIRHWEELPG